MFLGEFTITDHQTRKKVKLDGYYKEPLTFDRKKLEKEAKSLHPTPANVTDYHLMEIHFNREAELDRLIQEHKDAGDFAESEADMRYKHYVYQYHGCMYHGHLDEDCPMKYQPQDLHPLHKSLHF
jgi:hypothetical protein